MDNKGYKEKLEKLYDLAVKTENITMALQILNILNNVDK